MVNKMTRTTSDSNMELTTEESTFLTSTMLETLSNNITDINPGLSSADIFNHTNIREESSFQCATGPLKECLQLICRLQLCIGEPGHLTDLCSNKFPLIASEIKIDTILSEPISPAARVILILLFSLIIIVSVIGNLLVIITFIVNIHMRSVTNIFILSLAISDLLVIVICAPINMSTAINTFWTFSSFACKLMPFLITFVVACSSLTLCCIAFDRYYAIVHPLKLKFLQTPTRASILQIIVWVISGAASIPYCFFFDKVDHAACKDDDEESKYLCKMVGHEDLRAAYETWITPFILFLGPFLFMSGMYAVICHKLWIQRPIGAGTQVGYDGRLRLKKKAIKMLITVVILFVLGWSPILCFNGIARKYELKVTRETLSWRALLQCLALGSCCWNPIVYAFMNERFRKAFTTLLVCWRKRVYPLSKGTNALRMSLDSRKTTTQLEKPGDASGTRQTSDTKC